MLKPPITCTCLSVAFGRYLKWISSYCSSLCLSGGSGMVFYLYAVWWSHVVVKFIPSLLGIILSTWQFWKFTQNILWADTHTTRTHCHIIHGRGCEQNVEHCHLVSVKFKFSLNCSESVCLLCNIWNCFDFSLAP